MPTPTRAPSTRSTDRGRIARCLLVAALSLLPASAALSATDDLYHPAELEGNTLTLRSLPDFQLTVGDDFTYLGSTSFVLDGKAKADVFFFAAPAGDSIERLVKVQLESLADEKAANYHWEGSETLTVGDAEYLLGYWCFDAALAIEERPGSDTARTQEWLAAHGHHQTGVFVGTRMARVFADGRSELLIFYGETTRLTGIDCNDEETAAEHLPRIIGRSQAAFALRP